MEHPTKIILEASPNNLDTSNGAYDVYRLVADEFTSFDDLAFVETVDQLPEGAVRINEDEPTGPDYDAVYEVR